MASAAEAREPTPPRLLKIGEVAQRAGVGVDTVSWGSMLNEAQTQMFQAPLRELTTLHSGEPYRETGQSVAGERALVRPFRVALRKPKERNVTFGF